MQDLTGTARRNALMKLTQQERLKYEIAKELGLLERVREVGWAGLTAKETGRIGGLIKSRNQQH
ncbi:MAG: small, acid-soluble spore protein, alpha/beta type [Clostridia bacterium]|nr:small, acid-soluble spore protein, alpha/beta type [Clostridia bacterium]